MPRRVILRRPSNGRPRPSTRLRCPSRSNFSSGSNCTRTKSRIGASEHGDARKGFKMEGIYKSDGDVMAWCCFTGEAVKERPQEFRAPQGWDGTLYHMTRVKRANE